MYCNYLLLQIFFLIFLFTRNGFIRNNPLQRGEQNTFCSPSYGPSNLRRLISLYWLSGRLKISLKSLFLCFRGLISLYWLSVRLKISLREKRKLNRLFGRKKSFGDEQLCNLYGIGRSAFPEIVGDTPQVEAVFHRFVPAYSSYEHLIFAPCIERGGIDI